MRSLKCLVIEDDPTWQRTFTAALVKRSFTAADIKIAADKSQALVDLETWDADLVILDLGIDAAKGKGDIHRRHGRDVLARIGELNRQRTFRMMVLVISGLMDEYDQQEFETSPWVVSAVNKADVTDALPNIIKRAQKQCLPVYRDLKNHWSQMYAKFEAVMNEQTSSANVLFLAYDIASGVLENLGHHLMGANYPLKPTDDDLFLSIEVLRGTANKIDQRKQTVSVTPDCWIGGVIYEHFHTIRRYSNGFRHSKELAPGPGCKMPLDAQQDADVVASLENFERAAGLVRVATIDILEWYLPWHMRTLSTAAPKPPAAKPLGTPQSQLNP